jgi:hypothetical protein
LLSSSGNTPAGRNSRSEPPTPKNIAGTVYVCGQGIISGIRLILGGTQFIGRTLAKLALSDGWQVTTFAFRTAASRLPGGTARSLAAAAASTEFDWLIKDSRDEAFNEAGPYVGTPVLRIGGTALFGPVITPAPRGEAAGRLWDGRSWSPGRTASSSSSGAGPQAVL